MTWNAAGKIAVVPPRERPPAHNLSPSARDLLAQALTLAAQKLAVSVGESNIDRRIAEWLHDYARESLKGGAALNIILLHMIVQNLRALASLDEDAFANIDVVQFSGFTGNHDALTRYYPDFEDYQQALAGVTNNIPDPPFKPGLAELLRQPEASGIIDASVPDAIDDVLPPAKDLPAPTGANQEEMKERKYALLKIIERLKALLEMPPKIVEAFGAITALYARLQPLFDWLKNFL